MTVFHILFISTLHIPLLFPVLHLASILFAQLFKQGQRNSLNKSRSALPVNARTLYTEGDAKIDAGPAGVRLAAVTATGISRDGEDFLQGALSFQRSLLWLPTGVQTPCWRWWFPVQFLTWEKWESSKRASDDLLSWDRMKENFGRESF